MKKKEIYMFVGILIILFFVANKFNYLAIADFSSNFYTKNGNNIVLTDPNVRNYGESAPDVTGFNAVGINSGGRDWLIQFANQSLVLKPTCLISGSIYDRDGKFSTISVNKNALASVSGEDLICVLSPSQIAEINAIVNSVSSPHPKWDSGTTVTWYFVPISQDTPSCSDEVQNQDETGIDSGGVCGNPNQLPTKYIIIGIIIAVILGFYLTKRMK